MATQVFGAEFRFDDGVNLDSGNWWEEYPVAFPLTMDGTIERGDLERLLEAASNATHEDTRWNISLNSLGGDVIEAIRIGGFLRTGHFEASVGMKAESAINDKCASACFLVWVGAVERSARPMSVGIHRPHYDETVFGSFSVQEASSAYRNLDALVRSYLQDMGVATYWIDIMFSIPSDEVYWLSGDEIALLSGPTPYFSEWLKARCPERLSHEERLDFQAKSGSEAYQNYLSKRHSEHHDCVKEALYEARQEARSAIDQVKSK